MADTRPVSMTTDDGHVSTDGFVVYKGAGNNPLLPMAPFSDDAIAKAKVAKATMVKVLQDPARHGLKAPRSARGTEPAHWAKALEEAKNMYIPDEASTVPAGFQKRRGVPVGLLRQSATAVQDSVVGAATLVPTLVPAQAPHVGSRSRQKRRPYINIDELPMPAAFLCEETPGVLTVALMMVTGVATDRGDGDDTCKGIWHASPTPKGNGTGNAKHHVRETDFIGAPRHRMLTADKAFNHGSNSSWKTRRGGLSVTASGMRLWSVLQEEAAIRMDPNATAIPPALLTAFEARSRDKKKDDEQARTGCAHRSVGVLRAATVL